jgi:hypothetical protein
MGLSESAYYTSSKMSDFDGFLTKTERSYLLGKHEPPSDNAEQQMRYKIRERTKKALEDLDILAHGLSQSDMENILFDSKGEHEVESWELAQDVVNAEKSHLNNMTGTLSFLYLATLSDRRPLFKILTEQAILRAYNRQDRAMDLRDIEVTLDVDVGPRAEDIDTDSLGQLSQKKLQTLLNSGQIGLEEVVDEGVEVFGKLGFTEESIEQLAGNIDPDE